MAFFFIGTTYEEMRCVSPDVNLTLRRIRIGQVILEPKFVLPVQWGALTLVVKYGQSLDLMLLPTTDSNKLKSDYHHLGPRPLVSKSAFSLSQTSTVILLNQVFLCPSNYTHGPRRHKGQNKRYGRFLRKPVATFAC